MTDTTETKTSKKPAFLAYVIREGKIKNRWKEIPTVAPKSRLCAIRVDFEVPAA